MSGKDWDDGRIERLKGYWKEGQSATQIAQLMATATWKPSRNAIIGKLHRMGLSEEGRGVPRAKGVANGRSHGRGGAAISNALKNAKLKAVPKPAPAPKPKPRDEDDDGPPMVDEGPLRPELLTATVVGLINLADHACKWPIGDAHGDELGFCGRQRADGAPYCRAHRKIAWTGVPAQKPARRLARYG